MLSSVVDSPPGRQQRLKWPFVPVQVTLCEDNSWDCTCQTFSHLLEAKCIHTATAGLYLNHLMSLPLPTTSDPIPIASRSLLLSAAAKDVPWFWVANPYQSTGAFVKYTSGVLQCTEGVHKNKCNHVAAVQVSTCHGIPSYCIPIRAEAASHLLDCKWCCMP